MMQDRHPNFTRLMESAYDKYKKPDGPDDHTLDEDVWLSRLSAGEKFAVHFGNMNYQVENGGWSQWGPGCNNYGTPDVYQYLLVACDILGTETAGKVKAILKQIYPSLKRSVSKGYMQDEEDDERFWQLLRKKEESANHAYYAVNETLLDDVESFLARVYPDV